jgi:hypothetical protein
MMTARRSPLGGVARLGVPEFDWGGNCIHGVQSRCGSNGTVCPTSFPNPNALGAAFNYSVWERMGEIIGLELRSLWLQGVGENHSPSGLPHIGLDCWSPNIGIVRTIPSSFSSPSSLSVCPEPLFCPQLIRKKQVHGAGSGCSVGPQSRDSV